MKIKKILFTPTDSTEKKTELLKRLKSLIKSKKKHKQSSIIINHEIIQECFLKLHSNFFFSSVKIPKFN